MSEGTVTTDSCAGLDGSAPDPRGFPAQNWPILSEGYGAPTQDSTCSDFSKHQSCRWCFWLTRKGLVAHLAPQSLHARTAGLGWKAKTCKRACEVKLQPSGSNPFLQLPLACSSAGPFVHLSHALLQGVRGVKSASHGHRRYPKVFEPQNPKTNDVGLRRVKSKKSRFSKCAGLRRIAPVCTELRSLCAPEFLQQFPSKTGSRPKTSKLERISRVDIETRVQKRLWQPTDPVGQ